MSADFVSEAWGQRLREVAAARNPLAGKRVLCAHNAVVDYLEFVDPVHVQALVHASGRAMHILEASRSAPARIEAPEEFLAALLHAMRDGKALHVVSHSDALFDWLNETFAGPDKQRMGGQAGITANQLARMGARVTFTSPALSKRQAALFVREGVEAPAAKGRRLSFPTPAQAARPDDPTKVNWIFEFKRGHKVQVGPELIDAPRTNRVIIASRARVEPTFREELRPFLPELAKRVQAAFLAGYHYLEPEHRYSHGRSWLDLVKLEDSALAAMKKANPSLFLHFEYVPFPHPEIERQVISLVTKHVDSLGCNEVELRELLRAFKLKGAEEQLARVENAFSLYEGMRPLFEKLKLKRFHLHTLGYHLLLLTKPYPHALEKVRDAVVFAGLAGTAKSLAGGDITPRDLSRALEVPVSETGLNQVRSFESALSIQVKGKRGRKKKEYRSLQFDARYLLKEGIMDMGPHLVLIVPTQINPRPAATVGLGDVVSSVALAAEV
jgi:ADP-dependent phosphofructokinase/glucokinase